MVVMARVRRGERIYAMWVDVRRIAQQAAVEEASEGKAVCRVAVVEEASEEKAVCRVECST